MSLVLFLRQAYFWLAMVLMTLAALVISPFFLLFVLLFCKDKAGTTRKAIWFYGKAVITALRPVVPTRVENAKAALDVSPCIIATNHQSFLDLYFMACQSCSNLCIVVAKWPFRKLFFFAPFMILAGYVRVGDMDFSEKFVESCAKALKDNATILCFAEGTRSRDGQLGSFQSGVFRVAAITGTPVVPMIFFNTGALCPPGTLKVRPGEVHVKLLAPIYPKPGKKAHYSLRKEVHELILNELDNYAGSPASNA